MALRNVIEVDTSMGKATATPVDKSPAIRDEWLIEHPWGQTPFFGTTAEAKAELNRLVKLNDTEE